MQYLCQAFDADPGQSAVLIMLARLCLNRGDAERARALAAAAHQVAMVPDARAHALVLQGRAHHALSNFKDAYTCYQKVSLRQHVSLFWMPLLLIHARLCSKLVHPHNRTSPADIVKGAVSSIACAGIGDRQHAATAALWHSAADGESGGRRG